jgi:hypothetical protein
VTKRRIASLMLALVLAPFPPAPALAASKVPVEDQRLDAYVQARMAEGDGIPQAAARASILPAQTLPAEPTDRRFSGETGRWH